MNALALLKRVLRRFESRTFYGGDGSPYLTRWYIWPRPTSAKPRGADHRWLALFIHYIHHSDADPDEHNHPWLWALALILWKGYRERRNGKWRLVLPLHFNWLTRDTFHLVELLDALGSVSVLLAGPPVQEWGFKDSQTGEFIEGHEYIARRQRS